MDSEYFYFNQTAGFIRTDHRRIYCFSSGSMACQLVGCLGRQPKSSLKDVCNPSLGFNINSISGAALFGGIAAAMVGSVFSSDAWNNVTFIAGEIKNPQKNIGLSLFLGTLIVTVIYVCANLMYVAVLAIE